MTASGWGEAWVVVEAGPSLGKEEAVKVGLGRLRLETVTKGRPRAGARRGSAQSSVQRCDRGQRGRPRKVEVVEEEWSPDLQWRGPVREETRQMNGG